MFYMLELCVFCNTYVNSELLSYTRIVVYSRDHKGVGVAHKIKLPKKQPQFSLTTMRQYWLGKTKPKQAFRSTRNTFNKLLWNFGIF